MKRDTRTGSLRSRRYLVISWHEANPRASVRLDGYYFGAIALANGQAKGEREAGRLALVVAVTDDTRATIPDLPDELLPDALLEEVPESHD